MTYIYFFLFTHLVSFLIFFIYKTKYSFHQPYYLKTLFDSFFGSLLLILLLPFFIIISLIQKIFYGSPILYKSKRMITPNKAVTVYKFRSMVVDAKSDKYDLDGKYMNKGFLNIPLESEVYTNFGRFLERFQFVEIPQIYNIFKNGLSIVGNRPLPEKNLKLFDEYKLDWHKRFNSPPGMTGIAQIVDKHVLTSHKRLELEILYSNKFIEKKVILIDIKILMYTIMFIFLKKRLGFEDAKKLLS